MKDLKLPHLREALREWFPGKENAYTRMSIFRIAQRTLRHPACGVGSAMLDIAALAPARAFFHLSDVVCRDDIFKALKKDCPRR
jgi:hypothetical protein